MIFADELRALIHESRKPGTFSDVELRDFLQNDADAILDMAEALQNVVDWEDALRPTDMHKIAWDSARKALTALNGEVK